MGAGRQPEPGTADREIVVGRVVDAPRELVFEAFTAVRHLSRWWGPEGFSTTTSSFEFRVGGEWQFTMHGPDGTHRGSRRRSRCGIPAPETITLRAARAQGRGIPAT